MGDMATSERALLDTIAMVYSAGVIAYLIILTSSVALRRSLFTPRTFRIYCGSSVIMIVAALAGFFAVAEHLADFFVAFLGPILIYPLREFYLGAAGREEVSRIRALIKVFRPGARR